jgi:pimeloyl-ACP methyl ester carboxylesterase
VAIDSSERIDGLVLEASPTTLRGDVGLEAFVESVVCGLQDPIDPGLARSFVVDTSADQIEPHVLDLLVAELLKVPAHVWKETFAGLLQYDDTAELGRITMPTLLVWGDSDPLIGRDMQDLLARRMPDATSREYPDVGHTPRWQDPQRFAADVAEFAIGVGTTSR